MALQKHIKQFFCVGSYISSQLCLQHSKEVSINQLFGLKTLR